MKILAVDTATRSCSVSLVDGARVLAEVTSQSAETHSRHLLQLIQQVARTAGVDLVRLDGFGVCTGPGSFTGLRIGISSIKGLAYSLNKPVVGVSSLKSLAAQCGPTPHLICPMIDARKQEVYFSLYRQAQEGLTKEAQERVAGPSEVIREIRQACLFIGNGAQLYRSLIAEKLGPIAEFAEDSQHIIQASTIARLSLERFERRDADDISVLVPHYVRKSDAELYLGAFNALKS
jgi:tRNA threonylcarbamoyladenosine biosynthesis protein TsaB